MSRAVLGVFLPAFINRLSQPQSPLWGFFKSLHPGFQTGKKIYNSVISLSRPKAPKAHLSPQTVNTPCTLFRGAPGVWVMKTKPSGLKILMLPEQFHLANRAASEAAEAKGTPRWCCQARRHSEGRRASLFYRWRSGNWGQRFVEVISDDFNATWFYNVRTCYMSKTTKKKIWGCFVIQNVNKNVNFHSLIHATPNPDYS